MKRSEINRALKEMERIIQERRFCLPPFYGFTPEKGQANGHDYDEVRDT